MGVRPLMQITALARILKVRRMAGNAFLVAFAADTEEPYELFIPSAGELAGFMSPVLRNQTTGERWIVDWATAELIAAHLETVLETAGAEQPVASAVIDALRIGKRYGVEN